MKILTIAIISLLLLGCMKPHLISVHGESFTIRYDPVMTSNGEVVIMANNICNERFDKEAALTNLFIDAFNGNLASFDCR